jgi:isopentenyl-diphosphate delta-isomerase
MKSPLTTSRKQQHVQLTLGRDVAFRSKSAGFERWDFVHNALPELDFPDVDPSTMFLKKRLRIPLIVSSMTGGYKDAERINAALAEVCEAKGIAMGVGSQRQAIESSTFHRSFSVVRKFAKSIPVFGNIGAAEVAKLKDTSPIQKLVDLIQADGFAVHLNPLQELLQPEGTPRFRGVLNGIEMLAKHLAIPIIVKEIGAGISAEVARRLLGVGVSIVDVAGAGGTSWAGVEILRRKKGAHPDFSQAFWDWGIPTVDALRQVAALKQQNVSLQVVASGGVRHGLDAAKALAFGADFVAAARGFLQILESRGKKGLVAEIDSWEMQLRGAMFLTGSRTIGELQHTILVQNA